MWARKEAKEKDWKEGGNQERWKRVMLDLQKWIQRWVLKYLQGQHWIGRQWATCITILSSLVCPVFVLLVTQLEPGAAKWSSFLLTTVLLLPTSLLLSLLGSLPSVDIIWIFFWIPPSVFLTSETVLITSPSLFDNLNQVGTLKRNTDRYLVMLGNAVIVRINQSGKVHFCLPVHSTQHLRSTLQGICMCKYFTCYVALLMMHIVQLVKTAQTNWRWITFTETGLSLQLLCDIVPLLLTHTLSVCL